MAQGGTTTVSGVGRMLLTSKLAQAGEIAVVLLVPLVVIMGITPLAGESPLAFHGVVWVANVLMLITVWLGLRLRGQNCGHFGLSFHWGSWRAVARIVVLSLLTFVAALAAFVVGAIVMANIVGTPQEADMSGYNYLHGNLPMLIVALLGVYIVSSFGEEVIYRAFLINRIAELGSGSKRSWTLAVVISAIIFGLIHSEWRVTGMVQTGFMGLALGVCYLAVGRNLWVTILAHGYADSLLLVQQYFVEG